MTPYPCRTRRFRFAAHSGPRPRLALVLAVLVAGIGQALIANAQLPREDFYVTNGPVHAVALSGNTLYIGGDFTQIGPATGAFVTTDATTGSVTAGYPKVSGTVYDMVSDGAGGWFLAGSFSRVGAFPRANLAHVLADNSVSSWNPGTDNTVYAIEAIGSTLYVGGFFATAGGQPRNRIAAIDATTGLATAWNPGVDTGPATHVHDIAVSGSTVYIGGFFTAVGGQSRNNIAALDAAINTNNATAWNPNSTGTVDALAISGSILYAGGTFTSIGGQPRNRIAALNTAVNTNNATAWNPDASAFVYSLAVSGTTVYVSGFFTTIGGQTRNNIAALDATINTNNATAWNPNANSTVERVFVNGTTVYAGGLFTTIGGQTRNRVAALDATVSTNNATAWDPSAGSSALAFGVSGGTVAFGGAFTTVGGVTRNRIAAVDITTGQPTAWDPNANDLVRALVVSGSTVYAGGRFSNIGGQFRSRIAALDANVNTNNATAWNPGTGGNNVYALAISGTTVYAGGDFGSIGGQSRNRIAALTTTLNTNMATAWNPNANGTVKALLISGTTIYVGGEFQNVAAQPRSRIAALDITINTNNATLWDPSASSSPNGTPMVNALAMSGTTVYAGGDFGFIGGQVRRNIVALDATVNINNALAWDPDANGPVNGLMVDGTTVYVGGFFDQIGGQPRTGMAALDATINTSNARAWNPNATSGANSFARSGSTLFTGGYFGSVGEAPRSYLMAIEDATVDVPPSAPLSSAGLLPNHPNPFGPSTILRFTISRPELVDLRIYDLAGREVASPIQSRRMEPGLHEVALDGQALAGGIYLSRLRVGASVQTRRLVHLR
jgi:hypothetical protein